MVEKLKILSNLVKFLDFGFYFGPKKSKFSNSLAIITIYPFLLGVCQLVASIGFEILKKLQFYPKIVEKCQNIIKFGQNFTFCVLFWAEKIYILKFFGYYH